MCGNDDNCPNEFNPDQSNVDDDTLGDVCDDFDGILDIRRVRLRQTARPGRGRIILRGDVLLSLPDDAFDAAAGIAVEIFDGLGLDLLFGWDGSECTTHPRSGRVTCRSGDRRFHGRFKPLTNKVGRLSFAITFKQLDLVAPFGPPIMLVITDNPPIPVIGVDRVGIVANCSASTNGLRCSGP